MAERIDLKETVPGYRAPRGRFDLVDIPGLQYLAVDGHGDPNTSTAYTEALTALYPLAYALRALSAREIGMDYVVPPLEGLWWADDMSAFTTARDKSQWDWTMMLLVPDGIGSDLVDAAHARIRSRGSTPARLDDVRVLALAEGRCAQTLHVGSYDDEAPVLERLHDEFLPAHGLRSQGTHHEIYLSDARRVPPDRLRTILRQPVAPASTDPTSS